MSKPIIEVQGLGKRYRIGASKERYLSLRDEIVKKLSPAWRRARAGQGEFWALKDVSFAVQPGEALGIIGRNGAGKSTLLKILSKITPPTEGRVVMRGRVASLLEVGTGFHPELTGRENIYLNGAILGMTRREIARKFDEIVAFAEIEEFLDTPVKRYSSGMYVRLAFAVAAHLDPEILLVDEVLAVGDAEFQKKCLGKMGDVAKGGRTVLFVSHNMGAISRLCSTCVWLDRGRVSALGLARHTIDRYLTAGCARDSGREGAPGACSPDGAVRLNALTVVDAQGVSRMAFPSDQPILVSLDIDVPRPSRDLCIGFDLSADDGTVVLRTYQNDQPEHSWPVVRVGRNRLVCTLPEGILNAGRYWISPRVGLHCRQWLLHVDHVASFQVVLAHGVSPLWSALDERSRPGVIAPVLKWAAVRPGTDGLADGPFSGYENASGLVPVPQVARDSIGEGR